MWPYLHERLLYIVTAQSRLSAQTALRISKATLTHERGSGAPVFSNDLIIRPKCCLLANLSIRLTNQGRALSICLGLSLCLPACLPLPAFLFFFFFCNCLLLPNFLYDEKKCLLLCDLSSSLLVGLHACSPAFILPCTSKMEDGVVGHKNAVTNPFLFMLKIHRVICVTQTYKCTQ